MPLTDKDLAILEEKGISTEKFESQLKNLAEGFPYLKIVAPATPGAGITVTTPEMEEHSVDIWEKFLAGGGKVVKMVPASGAASRMFKDLFAFYNGRHDKPDNDFMRLFFDEIENFAFFDRLNFLTLQLFEKSIPSLIKEKRYKDIIGTLLTSEGLSYGSLPKALLQFHKTMGGSRTPLEEHLAEGAQYAAGKNGHTYVHFTVSPEHRALMEAKIEESKGLLERRYGVELHVGMSEQKPSTDTVAVTLDGKPYYEEGALFFRPGGHGALIENLNDIDADVIFIKNIDNVVPDSRRQSTNHFKKVLGGILVATKQKADRYCRILSKGTPSEEELSEMLRFLREVLFIRHDKADSMTREEKTAYLLEKLDRPMRVCGMVKNEGEPGGGPFVTIEADGTSSLQILESSQINPKDKEAVKMLKNATHFNPVDLACATKNYKGEKFHLPDFVDPATGFISEKSRKGVEIKALELPGLWNGAMSRWNTLFIEVPADTFNPVKTVNDLLRPAHQPGSADTDHRP